MMPVYVWIIIAVAVVLIAAAAVVLLRKRAVKRTSANFCWKAAAA